MTATHSPHDTVQAAIKRLADAGLAASSQSMCGCTVDELKRLEAHFSLRVPSVYREFLLAMGHDAGGFLVGSDYSYSQLFGFRDAATGLLADCGSRFTLPATAFVFFFHQGYSFLFFDTVERDDDPKVVLFTDSEEMPRSVFDTFTGWLNAAIEGDITAYEELKGS